MNENPADRMTVPAFTRRKGGTKLSVLTCYDYPTARIFDDAGVDALLVGDSLGTTIQGQSNTVSVTLDHVVYHTSLVARGARRSLVVADMPFLSHQASFEIALRNAGRLIQEGNATAVKLEGGRRTADTIARLVEADVPVMGHIGLTPQSILKLGKYKVERDEKSLLLDAKAIEAAGCFAMVLEMVPAEMARAITESVSIPTIGIGAGPHCDGQVLVWLDAMGMMPEFNAKFVKRYANLHDTMTNAARSFCDDVKNATYPGPEHCYK